MISKKEKVKSKIKLVGSIYFNNKQTRKEDRIVHLEVKLLDKASYIMKLFDLKDNEKSGNIIVSDFKE